MNVIDIMTPKPIAIFKTDSLAKALNIMEKNQKRHLVVIEGDGELVGIISDRDCKEAMASPFAIYDSERAMSFAEKILVQRIMTHTPTNITPQSSVQEAARLMTENHFSALPVMQDKNIIGIITSTDLLNVLAELPEVLLAKQAN